MDSLVRKFVPDPAVYSQIAPLFQSKNIGDVYILGDSILSETITKVPDLWRGLITEMYTHTLVNFENLREDEDEEQSESEPEEPSKSNVTRIVHNHYHRTGVSRFRIIVCAGVLAIVANNR